MKKPMGETIKALQANLDALNARLQQALLDVKGLERKVAAKDEIISSQAEVIAGFEARMDRAGAVICSRIAVLSDASAYDDGKSIPADEQKFLNHLLHTHIAPDSVVEKFRKMNFM